MLTECVTPKLQKITKTLKEINPKELEQAKVEINLMLLRLKTLCYEIGNWSQAQFE